MKGFEFVFLVLSDLIVISFFLYNFVLRFDLNLCLIRFFLDLGIQGLGLDWDGAAQGGQRLGMVNSHYNPSLA